MRILSVDFGEARTGLAVCDELEFMASPVGVLFEKGAEKTTQKIIQAATEEKVGLIVVGLPVNMNGTSGERAKRCAYIAGRIAAGVNVPVILWDERASTITAAAILSENNRYGKKRKQVLDAVAATVILESYLAHRKAYPGAEVAGVKALEIGQEPPGAVLVE